MNLAVVNFIKKMCDQNIGMFFDRIPNFCCNRLESYNTDNLRYGGFYFLYAKRRNIFLVIYCGQSINNIRSRLTEHYEKFITESHSWYKWLRRNRLSIKYNIYYTAFRNDYGPAIENFIIYERIVGIKFNLNTTLNGHSDILDIININYNCRVDFLRFFGSFYLEHNQNAICAYLTRIAAIATRNMIRNDNEEQLTKLQEIVHNKLLPIIN